MRTLVAVVVAICLASTWLHADQPQDVLQRARERAEHASPKGVAKAEVDLVRALVDRAAQQYSAEKYDESGRSLIEAKDVLTKASTSAEQQKHDLKKCELTLASVEKRLNDMDRQFSTQDRPPLEALLKQVRETRDKLVELVFQTQ